MHPADPVWIGGCGGVYFLAEPGELIVNIQKRDRNRGARTTELRAILVGPDRQVIDELRIPDAGEARGSGLGQPQGGRLHAKVERRGVYGLNISVSQDRYGEQIAWSFQSNCNRYVVETARGHKDARHVEPIVLLTPDRSGEVCFRPRRGAFQVEAAGIPQAMGPLALLDGEGHEIATLTVDNDGLAACSVPAGEHREHLPWRLHFPALQGTVQIDSVTQWESGDPFPDMACWTPEASAWFALDECRWMLTPYRRTVYAKPGQPGQVSFSLHNNAQHPETIRLELETVGAPWQASLSTEQVKLAPRRSTELTLDYRLPRDGDERACRITATPESQGAFSTYATLSVRPGKAPAADPLEIPLLLKPYEHENEQFGYFPAYPVTNQVNFDLENRPFVASGSMLSVRKGSQWIGRDLRDALRAGGHQGTPSVRVISGKVAFDRDNDVYLLGRVDDRTCLLHSRDGGTSFTATPLPGPERGSRSYDFEQYSGNNVPDGPPPILRFTRTSADPKRTWRRINDLELLLAEKVDASLQFAEPVMISKMCIGLSAHSGIPSTVVSRDDRVHVAWGEATDPEVKVLGLPAYVATYNRTTGELSQPALIGYGAPPNDIHNSPSIAIDSAGYLHVLGGTHGQPFPYARSLETNDAGAGWTETESVGENTRQTYIGFVCDENDTLHLVSRMWRYNTEPHPLSIHATLAYQRKPSGKPWEEPRVLIVAPFSEYSVFYHRLTIDRAGRLFLSYDCWSTHWFYRNDHRGDRRALMTSPDGGQTWKLVGNQDFDSGLQR